MTKPQVNVRVDEESGMVEVVTTEDSGEQVVYGMSQATFRELCNQIGALPRPDYDQIRERIRREYESQLVAFKNELADAKNQIDIYAYKAEQLGERYLRIIEGLAGVRETEGQYR